MNELRSITVTSCMKKIILIFMISNALASAETCRDVVRDASGRIVQTVESQKNSNGTTKSVTRDASGRIVSTSSGAPSANGKMQTTYRDASGRLIGSAATQTTPGGSKAAPRPAQAPVPPAQRNFATPRDESPVARQTAMD